MDIEYFVTRDQAKTLIELGFNLDCDYVWCGNFILPESQLTSESNKKISFPAPLICQALKWLRIEKGFHIWSELSPDGEKDMYIKTITDINSKCDILSPKTYDIPEEALSEGITECLKLLKND